MSSCRTYVRSILSPFGREVEAHGFEVAVGSSGTIQAVAAMAQAATGAEPPRSFNRFRLTSDEVRAVAKALAGATSVKQRARIPGVDADRADIILAGALILEGVRRDLRRGRARGVRVRAARGRAARHHPAHRGAARCTTCATSHGAASCHLAELCDEEPEHSAHVARLALELFDQLTASPADRPTGLDEPAREYLEAGALLANVGLFISHSQHHLHSYYVIRNTERPHRASPTTRSRSSPSSPATTARAPRSRATPSSPGCRRATSGWCGRWPASCGSPSGSTAATPAGCGRARCHVDGDLLVIEVVPADDAAIDLELFTAEQRRELLEEVIGRTVVLRPADAT